MNVIARNFFRLLRAGTFGTQEQLEPLSAYKWKRLYQVAAIHHVAGIISRGLSLNHHQYFVGQAPSCPYQPAAHVDLLLTKQHLLDQRLSNPLLHHVMKDIISSASQHDEPTLGLLLRLQLIASTTLTQGLPLRQLVELAVLLRSKGFHANQELLSGWIGRLRLRRMAQLQGALLIDLLAVGEDAIPFLQPGTPLPSTEAVADELLELTIEHDDYQFTQGNDIFVHSVNSQALLWHVRHSAQYFRYYPSESLTSFFTSFARSLQHIEE